MDQSLAVEAMDAIVEEVRAREPDTYDAVSVTVFLENGHTRLSYWGYSDDTATPLAIGRTPGGRTAAKLVKADRAEHPDYDAVVIGRTLTDQSTVFTTYSGDAAELWTLPLDRYQEAGRAAHPNRIET